MLPQKPPRVKRARLDCAQRQAQALRGLGAGQPLQFPVEHHDSQVLSQLRNGLPQPCAALAFAEDFFWRRSAVRNLHGTIIVLIIQTIFLKRLSYAALAQQHQGFVDDYPREPRRETGFLAKPLQVHDGPRKMRCSERFSGAS